MLTIYPKPDRRFSRTDQRKEGKAPNDRQVPKARRATAFGQFTEPTSTTPSTLIFLREDSKTFQKLEFRSHVGRTDARRDGQEGCAVLVFPPTRPGLSSTESHPSPPSSGMKNVVSVTQPGDREGGANATLHYHETTCHTSSPFVWRDGNERGVLTTASCNRHPLLQVAKPSPQMNQRLIQMASRDN